MFHPFYSVSFRHIKTLPLLLSLVYLSCKEKGGEKNTNLQQDISISKSQSTLPKPAAESLDSVISSNPEKIHVFRSGETLWKLGKSYYGNRHYAALMAKYNGIEDVNRIQDSTILKVPSIGRLVQSDSLKVYSLIPETIDQMLQARTYFVSHEKTLKEIRDGKTHQELLVLPEKTKKELDLAIAAITQAIEELKAFPEDPPLKMIGQLQSLSQNLTRLSEGKHDGVYAYDLDMVHQRWINALKNGIVWAKQRSSFL
ncbi:LysM peptidoglycan-binding domain-containing protein [Spongiimicrobium salis]|uniref:LysM peptidoglycan-binding domain-containing protein n=1 Tax=Spongiimicrobium salis TaxID=1667022 RepID=UPI00374CAF0E